FALDIVRVLLAQMFVGVPVSRGFVFYMRTRSGCYDKLRLTELMVAVAEHRDYIRPTIGECEGCQRWAQRVWLHLRAKTGQFAAETVHHRMFSLVAFFLELISFRFWVATLPAAAFARAPDD